MEFVENGDSSHWVTRFVETKWCDFILYDPSATHIRLLVPAHSVQMTGLTLPRLLGHIIT